MDKTGLNEIREAYLSFFESKHHLRMNSFSLVPKDDKSLLLINAGMAPLKSYFTGLKTPPSKRVTTCQKCIRTGDIENVGKTSRHGTFFEMLGNFSFGDYFKEEAIQWAWEFVTEVLKISKDRLYVTIYHEDDEAYKIWSEKTDIQASRIFRLGKEDNFWEIGQGPCGPSSEIHYDRVGVEVNTTEEFIKAQDEDKIIEFWNLVFTQFNKDENGVYNKLPNPNIDTGMGLERIATIMQGVSNIFEIDTVENILNKVSSISGVSYGESSKNDISLRIITDHVKGFTMLISDGVLPSNEGRGYVLRRLLRRAARHGRLLGIKDSFLTKIVDEVIENYKGAYPELIEKKDYIKKVVALEEERFNETIDSGMDILNNYIEEIKTSNKGVLSGEKAFKLYDTYGFPLELTEEILEEKSLKVDKEEFNREMESQRQRARDARGESNYMGSEDSLISKIDKTINTEFVGYYDTKFSSTVKVISNNKDFVETINEGEEGFIVTEKTPFYAEMGGQVGDIGIIYNDNFKAEVIDCKKNLSGKVIHIIKMLEGSLTLGERVVLQVDTQRRNNICKNHTATHILHKALKVIVGEHVNQAGSYVDADKLRFDFTHFSSMTEEELKAVEEMVNKEIMEANMVITDEMTLEEAKNSGAMALFDEKYSQKVRVVSVGDFSSELCGGTHVKNSGQIGLFKIISESGVAAGIRRIEAITGINALRYFEIKTELIKEGSQILKASEKEFINKLNNVVSELKEKEKEIAELKQKLVSSSEDDIQSSAIEVKGVKLIKAILNDIDANSLRELAEKLRNKNDNSLVVLASITEDKVNFVAMASKEAVLKGVHCGKIIKEIASIAGGGGGGRPDMAQAGGKLPEKAQEALNKIQTILETLIK